MDQAAAGNKIFLGNFYQYGENTNLDCDLHPYYRGNSHKKVPPQADAL